MTNYINNIADLVTETESNIYHIEKIIYTGRYDFIEKDFNVISKQSLVMLYSLWEGFIQDVFSIFMDEVNENVQSIYDLKENFMLSQVESIFKQFRDYPTKENSRKLFHLNLSKFFEADNHSLNKTINCKNNVGIDVLNDLFYTYGMEKISENWKDYSYPNKNLRDTLKDFLHYRNNQAHGNRVAAEVIINHRQFEVYKTVIIDLLYEISDKLRSCLMQKKYLKQQVL